MHCLETRFGEFLKTLRQEIKLTLREACKKTGYDPSNWSKVERGILSPPDNKDVLTNWARVLQVKKGSDQWKHFFDLADLSHGQIPKDILEDKSIVKLLPAFLRTLRGQKPAKEDIAKIIELIRNS